MAAFRVYTYETDMDPDTGAFRVYEILHEAASDGNRWRISARSGGSGFAGWRTIGICSTKRAAERTIMLIEVEARRKVDL